MKKMGQSLLTERERGSSTLSEGLTVMSKARQGQFIYIAPFNTRQFKVLYKNGRQFKNGI